MKKNSFYITTTLPYANADPHMGHALEFVQADTLARWHKLHGSDVFFNTGTDEHGVKIYEKAREAGRTAQEHVDIYAARFKELITALGVMPEVHFIRTTDPAHKKAAQAFWEKCKAHGDIYKKKYRGLYCVSDEIFLMEKDLVNGKCPNHQSKEPVMIEEENYFFAFSKYQKPLLALYEKNPDFVIPESRFNEIKRFVERGLEDFSISRLKSKMPWGVPVPGDDAHVMYVWFDALVNYISTIGWPEDMNTFEKWWPVVQIAGKDNLGHQAARWQAMLLSAELPPSKQIMIHGFITSGGEKMSKSVGNVVSPFDLIERYGTDAVRYYFLREISPFEDGDYTEEKFIETYNANLANGLGNLVSRVMKMATSYGVSIKTPDSGQLIKTDFQNREPSIADAIQGYRFNEAMDVIWAEIKNLDSFIQKNEPFKKIKIAPDEAKKDVELLLKGLWDIGVFLLPFMPEIAMAIGEAIRGNTMPPSLFKRVEQ